MGCLELPADRHCPGTRRGTLGRYAGQEAVIPYWSYHFYDQFAVVRTCALSLLSHWLSSTPRARRCIYLCARGGDYYRSFPKLRTRTGIRDYWCGCFTGNCAGPHSRWVAHWNIKLAHDFLSEYTNWYIREFHCCPCCTVFCKKWCQSTL